MSKKVLFYMLLDLAGIALTGLCGKWLCSLCTARGDSFFSSVVIFAINIFCVLICAFVLFVFLLYWWSDRTWSKIKRRFGRKDGKS